MIFPNLPPFTIYRYIQEKVKMKKYLIPVLILMLSVRVCAQEQSADDKVEIFMKHLKLYAEDEKKSAQIPKLSDSELKKYIKLSYEALEDDYKLILATVYNQAEEVTKTRKGKSYADISC